MNISSIVIQAKPEYVEEIIAVCEANDFVTTIFTMWPKVRSL